MSSIEEVTARLKLGEPSALDEFCALRRNRLLAYILGQLSQSLWGKVDPLDIFQEMMLTAWKYLPQTNLSQRDPFGWLCDLADQKIVDAARRFSSKKRDVGQEVALASSILFTLSTPSFVANRNEEHEKLQAAILTLPAPAQEALKLRFQENLPPKEIAQRLGKTEGAVRVLLSRSLVAIRKSLS